MRGVVLAAGYGKRLRPLTIGRAKPAVPFLNRPLIDYSLDLFRRSGIEEVAVNLHHAPETVVRAVEAYQDRISAEKFRLVFSEEKEILGTAGALGPLKSFLAGNVFVVSNGKIYFELENLEAVSAYHRDAGNLVTMVLTEREEDDPFTPVWLSPEHRVTGFGPQSTSSHDRPYTFTGVQLISPRVLEWVPHGRPFDTIRDLYPRIRKSGGNIGGWVSADYWCECSWPRRYLEKSFDVLHRRGLRGLSEDPGHERTDQAILGAAVEVGPRCRLDRTIIWGHTRIGAGCRLHNVVISGGLELPAATRLVDVVITPRLENLPGSLAAEGHIQDCCVIWPLNP